MHIKTEGPREGHKTKGPREGHKTQRAHRKGTNTKSPREGHRIIYGPKGAKSKLQHLDNPTRSKPNYLEMEINTLEGEIGANSSGNSHPESQSMEEAELEIWS